MHDKKKILFVINSLGCGGAEKSLVSLLPLIDYSKYEVDLQMFNPTGMFLELLPNEINILPKLDYYKFLNLNIYQKLKTLKIKYIISFLTTSISLRINNKKKKFHDSEVFWKHSHKSISNSDIKYDIAIAWGQGNPTHYVAEKVQSDKKLAWINADYISTGHNMYFDKPFYDSYEKIVSVSNQLEKQLQKEFPKLKHKLTTVLDIQNSDLINKMSKLKTIDINKADKKLSIVTVGRMVQLKGYDLAVEAGKILKENNIDFEWYFVGDGPERESIKNKIKEYGLENNIFVLGAKSNPYPYIKSADIYVQPSLYEGYCLTLAEARILNKPIVTTNFDVVKEQITNEKNGLIVSINSNSIADGIKRLINDNDLRAQLVDNLKKEKKGNIEEMEKFYRLIEN